MRLNAHNFSIQKIYRTPSQILLPFPRWGSNYPNQFQDRCLLGDSLVDNWQASPFLLGFGSGNKVKSNSEDEIKISPTGYFALLEEFETNLLKVLNGVSGVLYPDDVKPKHPIIVAIDDSPMSQKLLPKVVEHFTQQGVDVYTYFQNKTNTPLPLPLGEVSFFSKYFEKLKHPHKKVAGAIMLTAGSRGWHWGGMRFLNNDGFMFDKERIEKLQDISNRMQPYSPPSTILGKKINLFGENGSYNKYLHSLIDFTKINKLKQALFFDSNFGSNQERFPHSLDPWIKEFYGVHDTFDIAHPKNSISGKFNSKRAIQHFTSHGKESNQPFKIGIRNNSDSSQLQVFDDDMKQVCSSDISCLILFHLVKNLKKHGIIIKTQDSTSRIDEYARINGLPVIEVPTGFQYISQKLKKAQKSNDTVLIGTDAQGGISSLGSRFLPDAHFNNFRILELLGSENVELRNIISNFNNNLKNHYTLKKWVYKANNPEKFFKNLISKAKTNSEIGICRINPHKTMQQFIYYKQEYTINPSEIKIYFTDGSWMFVRRRKQRPEFFDVILETKTPRSWPNINFMNNSKKHNNRSECLAVNANEFLDVLDAT